MKMETESHFEFSRADMRELIKKFHRDMKMGLRGEASSLGMIPAYAARPTGQERGHYIAIDLGGTNFRVVELELKGGGKSAAPKTRQFTLDKRHITGTGDLLFGFIARSVKSFMKQELIEERGLKLAFTFSFPVEQTGIVSGKLIRWTKGFKASGVIGRDVVGLLKAALFREGLNGIEVSALANDTVGTLAAAAYEDAYCDAAVIIGTGTNACYVERLSEIKKMRVSESGGHEMIINTEWGNFNGLKRTKFDLLLDGESDRPGCQILEKMVSGLYLGEITRLAICHLIDKKALFDKCDTDALREQMSFKTESMSRIEADSGRGLHRAGKALNDAGIFGHSLKDRMVVQKVCSIVSGRAARITAAALAAVVTKMDPPLGRKHTVAIDGSVYEKHPTFSINMDASLMEIFGQKARNIELKLTNDGSGRGAAILAALPHRS